MVSKSRQADTIWKCVNDVLSLVSRLIHPHLEGILAYLIKDSKEKVVLR